MAAKFVHFSLPSAGQEAGVNSPPPPTTPLLGLIWTNEVNETFVNALGTLDPCRETQDPRCRDCACSFNRATKVQPPHQHQGGVGGYGGVITGKSRVIPLL